MESDMNSGGYDPTEPVHWNVGMVHAITGEIVQVHIEVTGHPDPIAAAAAVAMAAQQMQEAVNLMGTAAQAVKDAIDNGGGAAEIRDALRAAGMCDDHVEGLARDAERAYEAMGHPIPGSDAVSEVLNLDERSATATGDEAEQFLRELTGF